MTAQERLEIYSAAAATMREWYGEEQATKGACLYWNQAAMRELTLRGYKPSLQAGDMHWRMISPDRDNGTEATWFGYEFDLSQPFSKAAIADGNLPEIHIWCCLPEQNAIVDFSTGFLAGVAEQKHGYVWSAPKPPLYVFGDPPVGTFYRPKKEAILYAWRFIAEKMAPESDRELILLILNALEAAA